jgi:hypothetical protein
LEGIHYVKAALRQNKSSKAPFDNQIPCETVLVGREIIPPGGWGALSGDPPSLARLLTNLTKFIDKNNVRLLLNIQQDIFYFVSRTSLLMLV